MTALDTNVLVRFVTWDDEVQARRAKQIIDHARESGEELFVSDIVIVEMAWVLARGYRQTRQELLATLKSVFNSKTLRFESFQRLAAALNSFEEGRGDFADYLIRERALEAGCTAVVTFDRRLKGQAGFKII